MDYMPRSHRLSDDEMHRFESCKFLKGLAIGLAVSVMLWWGIVCLWVSFNG